ncbi:MAG: DUF1579 domain-containing protein [Chitinophagaceae bacterium]|nr:DUF1579 domain-containing protein [Chitinophagaceae bacterium]
MKNSTKLLCLIALLFAGSHVMAQTDDQMKAWMAYSTPGEAQKMMSKSEGDWKAETTWWMDPSKEPQKSSGTAHNEMVMGGRYLTTRFKGDMMGMPFEGLGTIAYDNGKKIYISTWIDNMGTGLGYMEGKMGADRKSIELRGKMYEPTIGKDVMMREVHTFVDENHQKIEMYTTGNDKKEMKTMEINLSR